MKTNYEKLIEKLDLFVRKYYLNKILRGSVISILILLAYYSGISIIEYFGNFSITIRVFLFFFSLFFFIFISTKLVVIPIFKLFKVGKQISYQKASFIISEYFSLVDDKLLNVLELAEMRENEDTEFSLLMASIDQKIENLNPFNFLLAISFRSNLKYAKYLFLLFIFISGLMLFAPSVLTVGSNRIVNYDTYYAPDQAFYFELLNDSLTIGRGEDFVIKVSTYGKAIPEKVAIQMGGNTFWMTTDDKGFVYKLQNLNNSIDFSFVSGNISSQKFHLEVLPMPLISDFFIEIDKPSYTGMKDEKLANIGDLVVPLGTKLKWIFRTENISSLSMLFGDSVLMKSKLLETNFFLDKQVFETQKYAITIENEYFKKIKYLNYSIEVIPDLFPQIYIEHVQDSVNKAVFYFKGNLADDYGFKKLQFVYEWYDEKGEWIKTETENIEVSRNLVNQYFYYGFNFSDLEINEEEYIQFYFEITDNDPFKGGKITKSESYNYRRLTKKNQELLEEKAEKNIEDKIAETKKIAEQLQKEIEQFQKKSIDQNVSDWEKTKMIDRILEKQNQLENLINEIKKENQLKNNLQKQNKKQNEELLEKQKQIEDLLENLITDEMKKLIEEIRKLQEKLDENKLNELNEELKYSYEDLSEQLDRNLELLKRYEVEENMNDVINQLNELSKKQEQLAQNTSTEKEDLEKLKEENKEQKEKFDEIQEQLEKTLEKNENLKAPMDFSEQQIEKQKIEQSFQNSEQKLDQKKQKQSSESMNKNAKDLKKMADKLAQELESNSMSMTQENVEDLKQILENLVTFSFDQETLLLNLQKTYSNNPKFNTIITNQNNLFADFDIIRDSLVALSERTPQINSQITQELGSMDQNLTQINELLEKRSRRGAVSKQQFVMSSANKLALLLSEVLDQMQEQLSNAQGGNQGSKKGKKQKGMGSLKQQQEQLKKQMEQMLQEMKNGKLSRNAKNKKLAEMLAEQEIFDQMMQDLMNEGSLSPQTQRILNEIKQMNEQNQMDIINKQFDKETIKRQEKIQTRLLDADKSENKREFEKKRESNDASYFQIENPIEIFEKKRDDKGMNETLRLYDLKMNHFYRNKYENYLKKISQN